jgi:hypothetical protein
MITIRYFITSILLSLVLIFGSCSLKTRIKYTYDVTYGSKGAGPDAKTNLIALKQGAATANISAALIKAFQERNLSILNNGINLLEPERSYLTETIQLTKTQIDTYNETNKTGSNFLLHVGPNYRIQYKVQYKLQESTMTLILSIAVILEQEGTGAGSWHKYMKDYNSAYFITPINELFHKFI